MRKTYVTYLRSATIATVLATVMTVVIRNYYLTMSF